MAKIKASIKKQFNSRLCDAQHEVDVQSAYFNLLSEYYTTNTMTPVINTPYSTDGLLVREGMSNSIRLLMEYKYDSDLTNVSNLTKVVAQVIYYLNDFAKNNDELPTSILIANRSQAVLFYAGLFYKYINCDPEHKDAYKELEFNHAASDAGNDTVLMGLLEADVNIRGAYVYQNIQDDLQILIDELDELVKTDHTGSVKIPINIERIGELFERFVSSCINMDLSSIMQMVLTKEQKAMRESIVGIFLQVLLANPDYYVHPNKRGILKAGDIEIPIHTDKFTSFVSHYDRNLTQTEIRALTEQADKLIEDTTRRKKGDFWTPSFLVERADQLLSDTIDPNYKETSLVWDSAAGTSNLTRDFVYNNLWVSTYHQWELDAAEHYNPEAKAKFQYDFLNDDVILPEDRDAVLFGGFYSKLAQVGLAQELLEAGRSGKRVIFYSNPPYGRAGKTELAGMAETKNARWMRANKWSSAEELYSQFMARVCKIVEDFNLTNVYIAFFSKTNHFTGASFRRFNQQFFSRFEFVRGNILSAGHFQGTQATWPVTFSIYKLRDTPISLEEAEHQEGVLEIDEYDSNYNRVSIGVKEFETVYDDRSLRSWVMANTPKNLVELSTPYPILSNLYTEGKNKEYFYQGMLFSGQFNGNKVGVVDQYLWLVSGASNNRPLFNTYPENYKEAMLGYGARRSIKSNWINSMDNFKAPDTSIEGYDEFALDCLVFAIFDSKNLAGSYRNFKDYTNVNIPGRWINELFWVDINYVKELANNTKGARCVAQDILVNEGNRYTANYLEGKVLSAQASKVLRLSKELYEEVLPYRDLAYQNNPECSYNAWDIGYAQLEDLVQEYLPSSVIYAQFRDELEILRQQIEEGVYRYGMLGRVILN